MKKKDEIIGKAAGAAKQAVSILTGDRGILNTLQKEHGEVAALLKRIKTTDTDADGLRDRGELFHKIRIELMSHDEAEVASFYEALDPHPEAREIMHSSRREHHELRELLTTLSAMHVDDVAFLPTIERLEQTVMHHVNEEEHDVFDLAKELLSTDELKAIDERFLDMKKQIRDRLDEQLGGYEVGRGTTPPPLG
jgi:hypothetical protein